MLGPWVSGDAYTNRGVPRGVQAIKFPFFAAAIAEGWTGSVESLSGFHQPAQDFRVEECVDLDLKDLIVPQEVHETEGAALEGKQHPLDDLQPEVLQLLPEVAVLGAMAEIWMWPNNHSNGSAIINSQTDVEVWVEHARPSLVTKLPRGPKIRS
ncbi:hypothetical protein FNAPI_9700 [Fusarium napiforme]|uniref:Uncharacterized protein n=1 Tax=Fusarium napiforme TaxID=42672 RepID=A0A8H5IWP1_9HYPO|nr:hypothetical protein FNAPI_9700 [Fusarium napiforme]